MSIAIVWSSANEDGLTASAKGAIAEGIRENGADVEEIYLNHLNLEHCRACGNGWGACRSKGVCVIEDDFEKNYGSWQMQRELYGSLLSTGMIPQRP